MEDGRVSRDTAVMPACNKSTLLQNLRPPTPRVSVLLDLLVILLSVVSVPQAASLAASLSCRKAPAN
jgi:hypothetical protein